MGKQRNHVGYPGMRDHFAVLLASAWGSPAKEGTGPGTTPALILRRQWADGGHCAIEVYIHWAVRVSVPPYMIIELDDRPPVDVNWETSGSRESAFLPPGWQGVHPVADGAFPNEGECYSVGGGPASVRGGL